MEGEFSAEPEVDVVTARTTLIRFIQHKYQKKAQTVICTMLIHNLFKFHTNYKKNNCSSQLQCSPAINKTLKTKQ